MNTLPPSSSSSHPAAREVLIASPALTDPNFARCLVYLQDHDAEGSLGFILNRPLGRNLSQLLPDAGLPDLPLYFGGPVQTDQFLLVLFRCHPVTHRFECELNPPPETVADALNNPLCRLRAFIGYAGWTSGQLDSEIARRDWMWTATDEIMVSSAPTPNLWELLVVGDFRWQAHRHRFPADAERN